MKYGKLDHIEGIDLSLPQDHPQTHQVLSGNPPEQFEVRVGGTMWNIPAWKGKIYPEKTPQKDMGIWYCKQFGSIELNATHYRIHPPETMRKWADFADENFRFCPKFPQLISHFRRFNNCEQLTDEFIVALLALEHKLGPAFIQLPPNFAPHKAESIARWLETWPGELRLAIEFRHPDWFNGNADAEAFWQLLEDQKIGAVISDTARRRDAVHMRCTADFLLLRFGGNDLHPSDSERLNEWADRLKTWNSKGLREMHLLMHQPNSIATPETCVLFADALNARMDVAIKTPQPISGGLLF